MNVVELKSGKKQAVEIRLLESSDYKNITKRRFFFDWKTEQAYEVYKLHIKDSNEILGLISLERIPNEWRVHIRLLTVSIENQGKNKQFDKIAGNLISFAAKIALIDYAELACVSLKPKSEIAQHYIKKYNMTLTGITLSIEVPEILNLIRLYEDEK
jgi:hypothetical protein